MSLNPNRHVNEPSRTRSYFLLLVPGYQNTRSLSNSCRHCALLSTKHNEREDTHSEVGFLSKTHNPEREILIKAKEKQGILLSTKTRQIRKTKRPIPSWHLKRLIMRLLRCKDGTYYSITLSSQLDSRKLIALFFHAALAWYPLCFKQPEAFFW